MSTIHINMTDLDHNCVYVTYEPRWSSFHPPFRWYTRWAYKIKRVTTNRNERIYDPRVLKQVQKGGKGVTQTQIGIVNNYRGEFEHPDDKRV